MGGGYNLQDYFWFYFPTDMLKFITVYIMSKILHRYSSVCASSPITFILYTNKEIDEMYAKGITPTVLPGQKWDYEKRCAVVVDMDEVKRTQPLMFQ